MNSEIKNIRQIYFLLEEMYVLFEKYLPSKIIESEEMRNISDILDYLKESTK